MWYNTTEKGKSRGNNEKREIKSCYSCSRNIINYRGISKLAIASSVDYYVQAPVWSPKCTEPAYKESSSQEATNVTDIGWSGSGLVYAPASDSGTILKSYKGFSTTGSHTFSWGSDLARSYSNENVRLAIKTDSGTFHVCDVNGIFYPDNYVY